MESQSFDRLPTLAKSMAHASGTVVTAALNEGQSQAIEAIRAFLGGPASCFILRGSAGTGKTTLIAALVKELGAAQRSFQLVTPTGRAARILGAKTQVPAETIHRVIYALSDVEVFELAESANDPGLRMGFRLKRDDPGNTLFIVDEASMVGDLEVEQDLLRFGSGRLLADLIEYSRLARAGRNAEGGAKLLLVGDPAQLPPVRETLSPALSAEYLQEKFRLSCEAFELTEVMRQEAGSAILDRATKLRDAIREHRFNAFDCAPAGCEILAGSVSEGIDHVTAEERLGIGNSVLVTYSNARARELNRAVRERLWGDATEPLRPKDLLLVNKNSVKTGLFNGDLVRVLEAESVPERRMVRIRGIPEPVGLVFRQVTLAFRVSDGTTQRIACRLLENLLDSRERDLTPVEQRALLVDFRQRNTTLRPRTAEFRLAIRDDPYFNALQVKYGYALTCHKAQGGEWGTVVVDFGDGRGKQNEDFFRWAYTAITRAKTRLLTIGAPKFDQYSDLEWGNATPPEPEQGPVISPQPPEDSDWDRLSFAGGQQALFECHRILRDAWEREGIRVERLDHLQHCERYYVMRKAERAVVQYWYKADMRVSRVDVLQNQTGDSTLAEEAAGAAKMVLVDVRQGNLDRNSDFIRTFRERVEHAIEGHDIRLAEVQSLPYRLRMVFEMGGRRSKIDFHYNGMPKWIRVEEVGGPGTSHGLVDRLKSLLDPA